MLNLLEINISNDPVSGFKRKMVHVSLEILENLHIIHKRKIVYYENVNDGSENGAYGRPILQAIDENESLSSEQKKIAKSQFSDMLISTNTIGHKVDPITGQRFENNPPDYAIDELEFWQSLRIDFINPLPATVSGAVYALMQMSMKSQDNNNNV